jgi:hypothetical protein
MHMTSRLLARAGAVAAALLALGGCATTRNDMTGPIVGVPLDLPDHFLVAVTGVASAEDPRPGEGCRSPMVDPRGKTLLTLRRSAGDKGDYWVESLGSESPGINTKTYGLTSQQLLRIDCGTGKAIGIVDQ